MSQFIKLTEVIRKKTRIDHPPKPGEVYGFSSPGPDEIIHRSIWVNMARVCSIGSGPHWLDRSDTHILFHDAGDESSCYVNVAETPEEIMARIK